ncbi:hypothetical protein PCANC_12901 [Puccinia coronata f. sp. avenae]|uniref:Uncharacterized protein n=1 Tax=Puccinia coronata f. sp. avenae TaxID=200324 RepID=A0A2N5VE37_9BASI|nr:hypothetical protein PCANC_12901 [Puccinia coronata f. sp. avenae]
MHRPHLYACMAQFKWIFACLLKLYTGIDWSHNSALVVDLSATYKNWSSLILFFFPHWLSSLLAILPSSQQSLTEKTIKRKEKCPPITILIPSLMQLCTWPTT